MTKITLTITGTHCASCKALIEDVCKELPGVHSCTVDYTTGKTEIEHTEEFDMNKFAQEIEQLGEYKVNYSLV